MNVRMCVQRLKTTYERGYNTGDTRIVGYYNYYCRNMADKPYLEQTACVEYENKYKNTVPTLFVYIYMAVLRTDNN